MNPQVDHYFEVGCGRCPLGNTPDCKVHSWIDEMKLLRKIILDCGLIEEIKWSVPVYTFQKSNILALAAFKEYCGLSFFKGTLLHDENHLLSAPGENTQAVRLIRFTQIETIIELEAVLKAYIYEAIEVEKAGLKVELKKTTEFTIVSEFQSKLDKNNSLKKAFEALTPGRQRAYLLHFSAAKQSKTREDRIEKCTPLILNGKGLND